MSRTRGAAFTIAGILLASSLHGDQPQGDPEAERLQGDWVIVSVERDGTPDPKQVGARLTFAGNRVMFQPTIYQFLADIS